MAPEVKLAENNDTISYDPFAADVSFVDCAAILYDLRI